MAEITYEDVEPGDEFGPEEIVIDEAEARNHRNALELSHPWFEGDSPYSGPIAEPTCLGSPTVSMINERLPEGTPQPIHAKQTYEFHGPVRVGEPLTARGEITGKYEKRGNRYLDFEVTVRDQSGTLVMKSIATDVMPE